MSAPVDLVRSLPGVCEARLFRGAAAPAGAPPDLLVEVPHGATRAAHFEARRSASTTLSSTSTSTLRGA